MKGMLMFQWMKEYTYRYLTEYGKWLVTELVTNWFSEWLVNELLSEQLTDWLNEQLSN
jgi:hypothetical protein